MAIQRTDRPHAGAGKAKGDGVHFLGIDAHQKGGVLVEGGSADSLIPVRVRSM